MAGVRLAGRSFWSPVEYVVVGDDHQKLTIKFRACWKRMKRSERQEMDIRLSQARVLRQIESGALAAPATKEEAEKIRTAAITDQQFVAALLVDWSVHDESGHPVPCTPEALEHVCDENDGLESALVMSYFSATNALFARETSEKNSEGQSGTSS